MNTIFWQRENAELKERETQLYNPLLANLQVVVFGRDVLPLCSCVQFLVCEQSQKTRYVSLGATQLQRIDEPGRGAFTTGHCSNA